MHQISSWNRATNKKQDTGQRQITESMPRWQGRGGRKCWVRSHRQQSTWWKPWCTYKPRCTRETQQSILSDCQIGENLFFNMIRISNSSGCTHKTSIHWSQSNDIKKERRAHKMSREGNIGSSGMQLSTAPVGFHVPEDHPTFMTILPAPTGVHSKDQNKKEFRGWEGDMVG